QLRRGERTLAFDWQPIVNETGALDRVLVMLSDVTEALRRVDAEREQKQLMAVFERLGADRHCVLEFLGETAALAAKLGRGGAPETEKRLLHALKGNAGLFGLSVLAARCHEIEDAIALDARGMTERERSGLAGLWDALHRKLSRFVDVGAGFVQV